MQDSFNLYPVRDHFHVFYLHRSAAVADLQNFIFQFRQIQAFIDLAPGLILQDQFLINSLSAFRNAFLF